MPTPEVIAHRGFTRHHPENTMAAFASALDLGADGIELDVHATADGVVVVHHDARVKTADLQEVRIAELNWRTLRVLPRKGPPLPALSEVVEEVAGRAKVYVEIKAPRIEHLVCALVDAHHGWCAVHSFDHRAIAASRELAPSVPRGVLMTSYLVDPISPLRDTASRDLWQQWELIDEALVAAVHAHHARLIAWTVNHVDDARRLASWGVDAICTDSSDVLLQALTEGEERGARGK